MFIILYVYWEREHSTLKPVDLVFNLVKPFASNLVA